MRVDYHSGFKKQYKKLLPNRKRRLDEALLLFGREPYHVDLYNHPLTGQWNGYRSIAFGGDWRAHYKMVDGVAIVVACGTHAQLYK
jgi:addiction module RelE/StbE family toxin